MADIPHTVREAPAVQDTVSPDQAAEAEADTAAAPAEADPITDHKPVQDTADTSADRNTDR